MPCSSKKIQKLDFCKSNVVETRDNTRTISNWVKKALNKEECCKMQFILRGAFKIQSGEFIELSNILSEMNAYYTIIQL